jgi:hypothetical protein
MPELPQPGHSQQHQGSCGPARKNEANGVGFLAAHLGGDQQTSAPNRFSRLPGLDIDTQLLKWAGHGLCGCSARRQQRYQVANFLELFEDFPNDHVLLRFARTKSGMGNPMTTDTSPSQSFKSLSVQSRAP